MKSTRAFLAAVLATLAVASTASAQTLEEFQSRLVALAAKVRPNVVAVTAYAETEGEEEIASRFSGIVLDTQGNIATVADEIAGHKRIVVKLLDGRTVEARVIGTDLLTNVGVLRIEAPGLAPAVPCPGGGKDTPVGSLVLAVGNPFGLSHSVAWGMVSGTDRTLMAREQRLVRGMIQTTAPVNPGDAGGLLADLQGRFVGMLSSTYGRSPSIHGVKAMLDDLAREFNTDPEFQAAVTDIIRQLLGSFGAANREDVQKRFEEIRRLMQKEFPAGHSEDRAPGMGAGVGTEGINFVLPAWKVMDVAAALIRDGKIVRGQLGIRGLSLSGDPYHRRKHGIPDGVQGILVASLLPEGPAAKAGIRRFDVLQALEGEPLDDPTAMMERVYAAAPGTRVKLKVWRKDSPPLVVEATVEELNGR
jgi:S1-C subfamily serine protease